MNVLPMMKTPITTATNTSVLNRRLIPRGSSSSNRVIRPAGSAYGAATCSSDGRATGMTGSTAVGTWLWEATVGSLLNPARLGATGREFGKCDFADGRGSSASEPREWAAAPECEPCCDPECEAGREVPAWELPDRDE